MNNPVYTGNLSWQEARHNPQAEKPVITVPNTHPAIIPEHVFKQTRKKIYGRTRQVINPRVLASKHLLSGLLKCKKCGALMTPLGAKSGKFHYYTCQTYLKSGRDYCSQKMIPAKKIEPFIAASIKEKILTEEEWRPHVKDLHETLFDGSIIQRRGFIRSFIKWIEVDYPEATIEYPVPVPTKIKDRTSTKEVLSLKQNGVDGFMRCAT